jgi:hypothetical protein
MSSFLLFVTVADSGATNFATSCLQPKGSDLGFETFENKREGAIK